MQMSYCAATRALEGNQINWLSGRCNNILDRSKGSVTLYRIGQTYEERLQKRVYVGVRWSAWSICFMYGNYGMSPAVYGDVR